MADETQNATVKITDMITNISDVIKNVVDVTGQMVEMIKEEDAATKETAASFSIIENNTGKILINAESLTKMDSVKLIRRLLTAFQLFRLSQKKLQPMQVIHLQ